jgi:glycine/D-amino acid oxidase-like deaminating enzyme
MKQIPYWLDTAPTLPDRSGKDLPDEADVVVIGGGLTGLSTAYHAARKGARVVLVEKDKVGSGASGRNGSMCTQGLTIGVGEARKRYGQERARELYDAFREAVDDHADREDRLRLPPGRPPRSRGQAAALRVDAGHPARPGRQLRARDPAPDPR